MTVKDILKTAAALLNLTDCTEYFAATEAVQSTEQGAAQSAAQGAEYQPSADTLAKVDILTRLANIVITELASSFVPIVCAEEVETSDGKIVFADLAHKITRVLSVKNEFGHDAEFKLYPEYLKVFGGRYTLEYEYLPENYALSDTVGFTEGKITAALLGYGVAAEYCITQGRFEEAVLWRKRYSYGVERAVLPKNAAIKGRCWL